MIRTFKEKAPTVQAVEFTNVLAQSPEVANLIGATSLSVDVTNKRTVFIIELNKDDALVSHTVAEGQIVGLINDQVVVMDATEFYAKYEAI